MSFRLLTIATLAIRLLAVLPTAQAQSTTATCLDTYAWMENDHSQSPCLVAAYVQGACNGGQFTVESLGPDTHYTGPTALQQNPCQCSTVTYSLVSACAVCQNRTYETWSSWDFNCSQVYISQYPEEIPEGTSVPGWAYLDVVTSDQFNAPLAESETSLPESSATATKPTGTISNTASSTASTFGTSTSPPNASGVTSAAPTSSPKKKSNAGAIAGGVVGGLILLGAIIGLIAWLLMRRRRAQTAPSSEYYNGGTGPGSEAPMHSPPPMSQNSYGAAPYGGSQPQRLYDPSDPSTYPQSPPTPTIHTTNTGAMQHPYGQQAQPGHYSGVPEL